MFSNVPMYSMILISFAGFDGHFLKTSFIDSSRASLGSLLQVDSKNNYRVSSIAFSRQRNATVTRFLTFGESYRIVVGYEGYVRLWGQYLCQAFFHLGFVGQIGKEKGKVASIVLGGFQLEAQYEVSVLLTSKIFIGTHQSGVTAIFKFTDSKELLTGGGFV